MIKKQKVCEPYSGFILSPELFYLVKFLVAPSYKLPVHHCNYGNFHALFNCIITISLYLNNYWRTVSISASGYNQYRAYALHPPFPTQREA